MKKTVNRTLYSCYSGNSIAITYEGEPEFVRRGFNFLSNYAGANPQTYFDFKYVTLTKEKLEKAFQLEGFVLKMAELWKGKRISTTSKKQEAAMEIEAQKFAEEYCAREMSNIICENFMVEVQVNRTDKKIDLGREASKKKR